MKRRAMSIFSIIVLGFFAIICGVYFSMSFGSEYVAKLNDKKVLVGEYRIYLWEQQMAFEETGGTDIWDTYFDGVSAEAVAKQNALDSIIYVKIMSDKAQSEGIRLNNEEKDDCYISAEAYYSYIQEYSDLIKFEDVVKVMEDNALLSKLYDKAAMEYEYSPRLFEEYYEEHKLEYTDVFVQYISIDADEALWEGQDQDQAQAQEPYELAEEIRSQIRGDYDNMADVYGLYAEDERIAYSGDPVNITELRLFARDEVNNAYIKGLLSGNVSSIMAYENVLYIFRVVYNTLDDEQALHESMRDIYIAQQERIIFDSAYNDLLRNAKISKNSIVWDSITIH